MGDANVDLLTARDAERAQRRVAGALHAAGLAAGDRVVMAVPSSGELLAALLGALRAGIVPVPLHPGLLPRERDALVADAEPALAVLTPADLARLLDGPERDLAPFPLARPMHYTSGTTGTPKGVWSGILDEASSRALVEEEAAVWDFGPSDVHLVCSPLHHSAPLRFAAGTLFAGGDVVVLDRFDPASASHAIAAYGVTTTFVVPAQLQRLFAAGGLADVSSLRLVAHAGAPCPESLKRRALDTFPAGAVWEFYGSTEGQFTVCGPDEWLARPGTVGRARPGRTLTVDDEGVVWCTVPAHGRFEYWRDAARTAEAWRAGAFTVGDVGRLDGDGYLFLDGRRDDLVITGGVNVYPAEIEQALADVPGVEEVAVFGAPDERWGQRVCVAVVGGADPEAVRARATERLAPHKRPKDVYLVDDLPRTSTGKVRRSAVAGALGLE